MDHKITDPAVIGAVLAYCKARPTPCWAIHVPPTSTIGGYGCELLLVNIETGAALIRLANGDRRSVPLAEMHLRAA